MIVSGLVLAFQVTLIGLLLMLALRVYFLMRTEPVAASVNASGRLLVTGESPAPATLTGFSANQRQTTSPHPLNRAELYTQLHILMGLQERDCRERGLNLATSPAAVSDYMAAWLYGAACELCARPLRHSDALGGLVAQMVSRKTGVRQPQALQAIATLTESPVALACFRSGLAGAAFWRDRHFVAQRHSFYQVVTANAFV